MRLLNFQRTKEILEKYKIPIVKSRLVKDKKEAVQAAKSFGWPIVIKVFSPKIFHRTEKGLVKAGIKNERELEMAFEEILKKSPRDREGFLVQKMTSGIEVAIGMKRDFSFGPVLLFGLGGVFVEVLKDISFGIAPLSKKEAIEMIKEIKGYKILKGYRGNPKVNLAEITKILVQLSRLSEEHPEIKEVDFNPIFCQEEKVKVADFKLLV